MARRKVVVKGNKVPSAVKLTANRMHEIERSARAMLQSIDLFNAATTSLNWKLAEDTRQFIVYCEKIGTELRRRSDA